MPGCKNRHSVSSGFLYSFSIYNPLQPLKALASISRLIAMEPCWWRSHAVREECGSEPLEPEITEGGSLLLVSPVLPQQEAPIQRFSIGTQPIWAANAATGCLAAGFSEHFLLCSRWETGSTSKHRVPHFYLPFPLPLSGSELSSPSK